MDELYDFESDLDTTQEFFYNNDIEEVYDDLDIEVEDYE